MANKVFSGLDKLPKGNASNNITPGCAVLEGGAFRGVYGEGVLDALMENDINLECSVGVSAGALNGINYVSGQIGRSARCNLQYRHDSRYISFAKRKEYGGIINFDFPFYNLPGDPLDEERFNKPQQRLIAVVTNCDTGETEYMEKGRCGNIFKAVQASSSMPYVSKMVDIDGTPYLDGGCSAKIAYKWPMENGYDKIVIVRTRPSSFRYPADKTDRMAKHFYRSRPAFAAQLETSGRRYNEACDEIDALEKEEKVFVIAPSRLIPVSRFEKDMEKLGELYYLGYNDAKAELDGLRAYLGLI